MADGFEVTGQGRCSSSDDLQSVATFRFWFGNHQWEWTPEAAVLHGYPPAPMTPTPDVVATHHYPDEYAAVLAMLEQLRTRSIPLSWAGRILDTDGRVRPVVMIAHPVRDRGRVVGADGVYLDLADYTDASVQASVDNHIRAFREHSAVIEQAKGMIMIVYGVSAERAFEVLSWRSQTGNTKLSAVCADIVAASTALRLGDDVRQEFDQLILTAGTPVRHDQPAPPGETESSSTKSGSTGPTRAFHGGSSQ